MIDTQWFISYKMINPQSGIHQHGTVITDVTPAQWFMYRKISTFLNNHILYAEEISPALAAELIHTAGLKTDYYKEDDDADI